MDVSTVQLMIQQAVYDQLGVMTDLQNPSDVYNLLNSIYLQNPSLPPDQIVQIATQAAVNMMIPNIEMQQFFINKAESGWIQPPPPLPLPKNMSRSGLGILPINTARQ